MALGGPPSPPLTSPLNAAPLPASSDTGKSPQCSSSFLSLPGEIRELIYAKVLAPVEISVRKSGPLGDYKSYRYDLRLMRVSRQIHAEAEQVFRRFSVFVSIETPWPEAQSHVSIEGHVPVLLTGEPARGFRNEHLAVRIGVPEYAEQLALVEPERFIILLQDLSAFTKVWFYSDLGHPDLNKHLSLDLFLCNSCACRHSSSTEQDPPLDEASRSGPDGAQRLSKHLDSIPPSLQAQLLLPFGVVKGLAGTVIHGAVDPAVEKSLHKAMAVPHDTPERCLELGEHLKNEGNKALLAGAYDDALAQYIEAFRAIHIVCDGRRRSVWADAFFHVELTEGPNKGQFAQQTRFLLRIRLVANVVLVYLRRGEYDEARFWGQRSLLLLQEGFGDAFLGPEFVASREAAKIAHRTALALRALGDTSEARRLFSIALKCWPDSPTIASDYDTVALRLG